MADNEHINLLNRIRDLEGRLEESDQLIEAIKTGEVDAFAIRYENESEIYTLQSGDYAYRILIEQFGEGAINVSEEGLIVYTNPYFFNLLNLPYEKVIGFSVFDFIDEGSKNEFKSLFIKSVSEKCKGEINLIANDVKIPVYISLTSLKPKLPTVGIVVTDLTEKKNNEQTILDYQKDLENKNQELLRSNMELASFAYIASHDLQEPLRKIQTFSGRIKEKEFSNLSKNGKDYFSRIQVATVRMQTLIEDLLTYSRTNTLERTFEPTDLHQIVAEIKDDLKEEIEKKHAIVYATGLCNLNVIPFQFRQLFYNLLSNSLKFSDPYRPPRINIKCKIAKGNEMNCDKLANDKKYCHISFSDNGIGFEQEYSEKIFEIFQRLHGRTEYAGTGIGLSIVKKIVENHSGFISAKSEVNKGTCFDIYFPAS